MALNPDLFRLVSQREDEVAFQRLEFLGDRVLGLIAADTIFYRYPGVPVSMLALKLAQMLSNQRLASTSQTHLSIQDADVFEAYVGALYVQEGLEACREWLNPILDELDAVPLEKPWRTLLNTYVQRTKVPLKFSNTCYEGTWVCTLQLGGLWFESQGAGKKQEAERDAVRQACKHLNL
jgi:ribonuclease-3